MEYDEEKIDQAVLAILYLSLHEENRAWKNIDWDAMERLHAKGLISNPISKAKSVAFSPEGLQQAEACCEQLFCKKT